ncbi:unnamed protein product [Rotaria socialis]
MTITKYIFIKFGLFLFAFALLCIFKAYFVTAACIFDCFIALVPFWLEYTSWLVSWNESDEEFIGLSKILPSISTMMMAVVIISTIV